jgi:uncharacterized membrane protein
VARQRSRPGRHALIVALQFLHVLFGVFWFGSQMYLDLSIKPAIAKLPDGIREEFSRGLGTGLARRITVITATGTVTLGALRGIAGGVFDVLDTAYGLTWLAAFAIGTFMMLSIWTRGFGQRIRLPLWYGSFFVMFSLMIAMRFGY